MEKKLFTVYDSKSETYLSPVAHNATGDALRSFADAVNAPPKSSNLSDHPEDFTLFEIGTFNICTGELIAIDKKSLANGIDVKINDITQQPQAVA